MLHRRWQRSKEMNQLKPKIGQNSLETVSSPGSLTDRRSLFTSSALTKSESSLRSMFARLKVGCHHFRFTALPGWACWGQLFNKPKDVDFSNCQSHSCCFYLRFLIDSFLCHLCHHQNGRMDQKARYYYDPDFPRSRSRKIWCVYIYIYKKSGPYPTNL